MVWSIKPLANELRSKLLLIATQPFYINFCFSLRYLPFIVSNSVTVKIIIEVTMVLVILSLSLSPGLYFWRMGDIPNGPRQLSVSQIRNPTFLTHLWLKIGRFWHHQFKNDLCIAQNVQLNFWKCLFLPLWN